MQITNLKVNHISNPVGFHLSPLVFSYVVAESTGKKQAAARILVARDAAMTDICYDTGLREDIDSLAYEADFTPDPASRYYWKVFVTADDGDIGESEAAYFETAKDAGDIKGSFLIARKSLGVDYFTKNFEVKGAVQKARITASALGIYEVTVNGQRAGEEYFAPGSNDYDQWIQYQTIDVTGLLAQGKNTITMAVAPGWYSGYFIWEGNNHIYGDKKAALLDLDIQYEDGSKVCIATDESWRAQGGLVTNSEIYHGEHQDAAGAAPEDGGVAVYEKASEGALSGGEQSGRADAGSGNIKERLQPRRSLPVVVKETLQPRRILHTPAGETVLDMGQNMAGWISFVCREPLGTRLYFQFGEILQDGNFYRENLRTAKAEFSYIADGQERVVRPHFTYYGFRYVKLTGFTGEPQLSDFTGEVIYSDLTTIGHLTTSNSLVNRLIANTMWGQKGNFVETPTDCPQRDERLGWTGDAQVFSGTALFQMDAAAFFSKYCYDMMQEQKEHDGCVPFVIPSLHMKDGGSAAWSDAATVIPWNVYLYTGDPSILRQQYPSMKMWADYIRRKDEETGGRGLWQCGFHFGDWLALDGGDPMFPTGGTEEFYVASCYYYLSTLLTAKAAAVLEMQEDAERYDRQADKIRNAIVEEYFTKTGRLAVATQTGYVLALAFGICPEEFKDRVAADLNARLIKDKGYLKTGFVGTPCICRVLSEYGYHEMAVKLLLNEECPGWLYPVRMGATTIWERWDSVMPDGTMNPQGMNSLNHYSYGSVVEWMYRCLAGIRPVERAAGFRSACLAPLPDYRLSQVSAAYDSPAGRFESGWKLVGDQVQMHFAVPFGAEAKIILPHAEKSMVECNEEIFIQCMMQEGDTVTATVGCGCYDIIYKPTISYRRDDVLPDQVPEMIMDI